MPKLSKIDREEKALEVHYLASLINSFSTKRDEHFAEYNKLATVVKALRNEHVRKLILLQMDAEIPDA